MKKLSFGSWAFTRGPFAGNPVSFHRLLHKLEDEGYQGVELGAVAPHPTPHTHETPDRREHVKQEVAEHGLAFSGLAPGLRGQTVVTSDECGLYLAAFDHAAKFAADLGIPTIRVDTVEPIPEVERHGLTAETVFERAVNVFSQCAVLAAKHGLNVTFEFEPHLPLNTPSEVLELVDAVRGRGHANFGVLFDTSHAHICSRGAELEMLRALSGRINHVHLADSDGTVDEHGVSRHLPLGEGRLDWDSLLPELPDVAWWTVDLYNCPEAWDAVAAVKKFLKSRGVS